jgi:hypothetical protein
LWRQDTFGEALQHCLERFENQLGQATLFETSAILAGDRGALAITLPSLAIASGIQQQEGVARPLIDRPRDDAVVGTTYDSLGEGAPIASWARESVSPSSMR